MANDRRRLGLILMGLGAAVVLIGLIGLVAGGSSDSEEPQAATTTTTVVTTTQAVATTAPATTTTRPPTTTATSSTTTSTSTTTTSTTTTTTTTMPDQTVEEFLPEFVAAIESGDVDFLFDRLHPAVVGGYGPDLCRNWIEAEILTLQNYQLTGPVVGPIDQPFTTPAGTGTIENAFSVPASFVFQGQQFDTDAGFALVDARMHWLGQCR